MNTPAWLERAAPGDLGVYLGKSASPRKGGLFVRHLCLGHPEAFPDPRSLAALHAADRYEAGEIDEPAHAAAVQAAVLAAEEAEARWRATHDAQPHFFGPAYSAWIAANVARNVAEHGCYNRVMADLMRVLAASTSPRSASRQRVARAIRGVFLEHFGDVERPVEFDPAWRTTAVGGLATSIYADRAFGHLPILGDALEDAGCADADLLGHCRGGSQHARGCWLLDLVLEKP